MSFGVTTRNMTNRKEAMMNDHKMSEVQLKKRIAALESE